MLAYAKDHSACCSEAYTYVPQVPSCAMLLPSNSKTIGPYVDQRRRLATYNNI